MHIRARVSDSRGSAPATRARPAQGQGRQGAVFAILWFLVTAGGFALSGAAFHFPGSLPPNNGEVFDPTGLGGAAVNGIATGLAVGGPQAFLLKRTGRKSRSWFALTVSVLYVIHAAADTLPDTYGLPLVLATGGFALGAAQWLAAGWKFHAGAVCTAATGFVWSAAMWAAHEFGATVGDWRIQHAMIGSAVGIGVGALTAALWILRPIREAAPAVGPSQAADQVDTARE